MYSIPLFKLNFDEREVAAAADAIRSGWISMGERTACFESRFAELLGARHAVAVSSGTAALHIAMACLIKPGDEVVVPSLTFVATVNAIRYVGGEPVFADIVGPNDLSLDPEAVRQKIGPKTRAILPVHYGGFACDMAALMALAEEHGLAIVEDAAHAPLVRLNGRCLGTFGAFGCFSFFSNKNMTCAEGGMLLTDDGELADRARLLRSHGMTTLSYERAKGHATTYDVVELGYNYRLDDIRAALGLVQLDKLSDDLAQRGQVRRWYEQRLERTPMIHVPYLGTDRPTSNYILPIVLAGGGSARRDLVRHVLAEQGVQTSVHYPAVHRFSTYGNGREHLPNTEFVTDHEITLPMYGGLDEATVGMVCDALTTAALKADAVYGLG